MDFLIVELTATEAAFTRFQRRKGELLFAGADRRPVAGEGDLPRVIQELVPPDRGECRVILALAPERLFYREVALPISDRRKLREILPLELKGETALDADELVFDALPASNGPSLAVWTRRKEVAAVIDAMTGGGLEPEIVSFSPLHWHLLLPEEARAGAAAITDGQVLVVFDAGRPLFFRPLGEGAAEAITSTLAALELSKGMKVERLYLHGSAATSLTGISGITALPLPVADSLERIFSGDREVARSHAGAAALAISASTGNVIDFRHGELAYTAGIARTRKRLRLTMFLAISLVCLIAAESGIRYYLVIRDITSLDSSISTIYREVFPNRKKSADEVAELRAELRKLGATGASRSVLGLMNRLAGAKGDQVTGLYEVEVDGDKVRLKGDARSFQAVNDFKARTAGFLSSAEVGEVKSRPDGTVSFAFRGTLKEGNQ